MFKSGDIVKVTNKADNCYNKVGRICLVDITGDPLHQDSFQVRFSVTGDKWWYYEEELDLILSLKDLVLFKMEELYV